MKTSAWLSTAWVLGVLVIACQTTTGATNKTETGLCEPGAFVFCRCKNLAKGTKLCQNDGLTFGECAAKVDGECGGEVEDPNTGKNVDGNGDIQPVPGDDDDDTGPGELDVCPGKPISVPPGQTIKLEGDTSRAVNDRRGKPGGACAAASGARDFVYRLTPSGSGKLEVVVTGKGALDPIVYLRTTCDDETTQAACGPQGGTKVATTSTNVTTGKEYFLFIDGASGGSGEFSATIKLTAGTFCGDGEIDTGEACDDTNHVEGDGCNASCRGVDGNPATGAACPGQSVHMWPGQTVTAKGATNATGYGRTFKKPSTLCDTTTDATAGHNDPNQYPGTDHVYEITPHGTGNMTVKLTPPTPVGTAPFLNFMLAAHATCGAEIAASVCANKGEIANKHVETLVVPVTKDKPVYIAVEGGSASNNKGEYTVTFQLPN